MLLSLSLFLVLLLLMLLLFLVLLLTLLFLSVLTIALISRQKCFGRCYIVGGCSLTITFCCFCSLKSIYFVVIFSTHNAILFSLFFSEAFALLIRSLAFSLIVFFFLIVVINWMEWRSQLKCCNNVGIVIFSISVFIFRFFYDFNICKGYRRV